MCLSELGQGQKAAALIEMVRRQNKETNKADIMISHKGLVFLNNVSKMLFHHAAYTHVNMHTSILPHFHLYSLIIFLKENKSGGTYKRGCRVLRRNQTSFRLSLGFPINVASVFEVQGKDKKNGKEKGSSQTGIKAESKASLPVSFLNYALNQE